VFRCEDCGLVIDRDLNAAINIRDEALRQVSDVPAVASSERKIACGAGSSGPFGGETFCEEAGTKMSSGGRKYIWVHSRKQCES
jgi:hypothetical protein